MSTFCLWVGYIVVVLSTTWVLLQLSVSVVFAFRRMARLYMRHLWLVFQTAKPSSAAKGEGEAT